MVSAIVCAYNEERTVKPILEVLLSHPKIDEVIAVDDGSTDRTGKVVDSIKSDKLIKIHHRKNLGKGAAIANGISRASGKFILFTDSDLLNFHAAHIDLLLAPLDIDPSAMVIGVPEVGSIFEQNFRTILKSFGGERATQRAPLLPLIERIRTSGYGVEAILNFNHIHRGQQMLYVPLPRLIHRTKPQKHALYKYLDLYIKENRQVLRQYFDPENKAWEALFKMVIKKLGI